MDRVLLMEDLRIVKDDTFRNVASTTEYQRYLKDLDPDKQSEGSEFEAEGSIINHSRVLESLVSNKFTFESEAEILNLNGSIRNHKSSQNHNAVSASQLEADQAASKGRLNVEEAKFEGTVTKDVILYYIQNIGGFKTFLTITLFLIVVGVKLASDWFIGAWVNRKFGFRESLYPLIYLGLVLAFGLLSVVRSCVYGFTITNGSLRISEKLLRNILRRPLSFFDTTPSG